MPSKDCTTKGYFETLFKGGNHLLIYLLVNIHNNQSNELATTKRIWKFKDHELSKLHLKIWESCVRNIFTIIQLISRTRGSKYTSNDTLNFALPVNPVSASWVQSTKGSYRKVSSKVRKSSLPSLMVDSTCSQACLNTPYQTTSPNETQ